MNNHFVCNRLVNSLLDDRDLLYFLSKRRSSETIRHGIISHRSRRCWASLIVVIQGLGQTRRLGDHSESVKTPSGALQ